MGMKENENKVNKVNYQKLLNKTLEDLTRERRTPSLLLHACCAPCSSYVLEYLSRYFNISLLFYNPNITSAEEYNHRAEELKRLVREMPLVNPVEVLEGKYIPEEFYSRIKGHEKDPEGGERCRICYELRLREAANTAAELHCDYFTTTLSISPLKHADWLNEIGGALAEEYRVPYLFSDFKKKNGYKRSIELSAEYGLYRQDYCGCVYSRRESEERRKEAQKDASAGNVRSGAHS